MNTSEGIPFANVFFRKALIGTNTDMDGNFTLSLDSIPNDSLHVEAMGYTSVNRKLPSGLNEIRITIELERSHNALKEVTITGVYEDPGVILMRKIIAHKPQNDPSLLDNYSYEAYNRLEADLQRLTKEQFRKIPLLKNYSFIFDNLDTISETTPYLPLYLTETLSDVYFTSNPKKKKEYIRANMVKGVNNENIVNYLSQLYQNVNIYRNYIPVFDKKFISPVSNDANFYYRYKIRDTQIIFGHRVIQVQFYPKRAGESCFEGDFWVVDTSYAIQRISMDVSKLANINWVDRVSFFQEFEPVDTHWFCTKDKLVANFTVYGSHKLPGFIGRKTCTYHNIKIDQPSVVAAVNNPEWKTDIIMGDSSKQMSDDWWLHNRPDSLTKNEKAVYRMVDTINSMPITTFYKNTITFLSSGVKDVGWLQLGPYYYLYSRNPVEGNRVRLTLGTSRKLKDQHFTAFVAYGDRDNRLKYGATAFWIMNRSPRMTLSAYYSHDIIQSIASYDQVGNDNIFSTLFRKPGIPWKLAFADDNRIEWFKEYHGGFSHKLILHHRQFTPYAPLPSNTIFVNHNDDPTRTVVSSEIGVELRYAFKEKYLEGLYKRRRLANKFPVLKLDLANGIKGVFKSSYAYQKVRFSVSENINIPPFGRLSYNLYAGKYFGVLPYSLLEIHPGNEFYTYSKRAFQMMNQYEFLSDKYAGFNIEHTIGGGIFNRIPAVKKLKLRQFWSAKGIIGSLSRANHRLNLDNSGGHLFRTLRGDPYLEIGTGVSNILQLFRIDFVWRVTPAHVFHEDISRHFGIFGSVNFEF